MNIPLRSLGQPVLMGIALNHTSAGRPSAEFYVRYSLSYEVDLFCASTVLRRRFIVFMDSMKLNCDIYYKDNFGYTVF